MRDARLRTACDGRSDFRAPIPTTTSISAHSHGCFDVSPSSQSITHATELALQGVFSRILYRRQDAFRISLGLIACEDASELAIRSQLALFEQSPHLACKLGFQQLRRE